MTGPLRPLDHSIRVPLSHKKVADIASPNASTQAPPLQEQDQYQISQPQLPQCPPLELAPPTYYDAAQDNEARQAYYQLPTGWQNQNGAWVCEKLNQLLSQTHRPLEYNPTQFLYPVVEKRPDGQLYCVYGNDGSLQSQLTLDKIDCEHVVPQTWFRKDFVPKGDLHHLYASFKNTNRTRGNAKYAEFTAQGGSKQGFERSPGGVTDSAKNIFAPYAGKGEVARASLYFLLRYPGEVASSNGDFPDFDLPLLLKWHQEEPPTDHERHRNLEIQQRQGNRNPCIDYPELVPKVVQQLQTLATSPNHWLLGPGF